MSDHHLTPDPIDEAYVRAEALLSDDAARAARRERVLAAVGREPAAAAVAPAPRRRLPPVLRRGGWLAAACVAGLSLFIVDQVYQPAPRLPQTLPVSPTPAASAPGPAAPAATGPAHTATASAPPIPATPITKRASAPVSVSAYASKASPAAEAADSPRGLAQAPPAPPPQVLAPAPPPAIAAPIIAPAPRAFPAEPPSPQSTVVTTERRAPARAVGSAEARSGSDVDEVVRVQGGMAQQSARRPAIAGWAAAPAFAARPFDQATRLRDAAEAGQTAEVETLLDQGAPVDAPDADGNTALIKSIQSDHPAAAAALSRHGASLDHKNHAGESARDIAAAKDDAALNQALGLGP